MVIALFWVDNAQVPINVAQVQLDDVQIEKDYTSIKKIEELIIVEKVQIKKTKILF